MQASDIYPFDPMKRNYNIVYRSHKKMDYKQINKKKCVYLETYASSRNLDPSPSSGKVVTSDMT